jgi:hypothetical protein
VYKVVSSWTLPIITNDRIDEPLSRSPAISSFLPFSISFFHTELIFSSFSCVNVTANKFFTGVNDKGKGLWKKIILLRL